MRIVRRSLAASCGLAVLVVQPHAQAQPAAGSDRPASIASAPLEPVGASPVVVQTAPVDPPSKAAAGAAVLDRPSLALGGFIAAQVTFDSNDAVRQNHLISVDGQGNAGRFGWAFDATRLNLVGRMGLGGFTLEGRAEADMQSAIFFRIRHAYAAVSKNGTTLLLGQTDTLIGNQVGPHNFNNDWMFAQGNAYDRMPQLRVSHDRGRFFVAAALLPNVHGAADVIPHAQARVMVRFAQGKGLVGAAGHIGYSNRVKNPANASQEIDGVLSYLAALDAGIPLGPLALSAQIWIGAGAAHGTGGHAIGNPLFVVTSQGSARSIPAAGGFVDLLCKLGARLALGVAAGASVIVDAAPDGVAVPLSSNATAVVYASFALRPGWVFALEAQGARTARALEATMPSQHTAVYDGRLLFGQQYSF